MKTFVTMFSALLWLLPAVGLGHPPIRLVMIDAKTIKAYGPLPWTRDRHAAVVAKLDAAGAKAIVLRFYFRDTRGDAGDAALVAAVRKSGKVLCELGQSNGPEGWQPADEWLAGVELKAEGVQPRMLMAPKYLAAPFESLARAAHGAGSIQVLVNKDGKLEGVPLVVGYGGRLLPSLGLRAFLLAAGLETAPVRFDAESVTRYGFIPGKEAKALLVDRIRIALNEYGCTLVNLTPPGRGYTTVSFADVLDGRAKAGVFRNAIVLVGAEDPKLDVQTESGAKSGLELVADQVASLFHAQEDSRH